MSSQPNAHFPKDTDLDHSGLALVVPFYFTNLVVELGDIPRQERGRDSYHSSTPQAGPRCSQHNLHCRGDADGGVLIQVSLLSLEIFLHLPELLQLCGELSALS